ncbi:UspA domain protein [Denitrovibrio acetiphilus DSM 12809]|jgi:nucleotide-binding universal stress UspA family protein|uniref:Universal stress protein n=1 Tax=Denitrovibrio acetiphilus (strain DSM 12809 / NBRC 114555 / N2460) TaxID=522772 RepID=D4H3M0_DENA2|nr:universal stress protein [Denitrovibrio acetiphilus]ADD69122.1 UspA domain protein [Denitrovibrio acetiphilus DSM 12809]
MVNVTKILYPTDFSDPSACALLYAAEMAKKFNAELIMLHVLLDESQMVSFYLPQLTVKNLSKDMEDGAKAKMEEFIEETNALEGIEYSTAMVKGIADDEIIKFANEKNVDMIVLGTHGRTGLEHVIFGSTAEKVVRSASCPVLTVHCPNSD